MSTSEPLTTAERHARYVKQNGRGPLTERQERQVRKTALRLEHGRKRSSATRPRGERASKGHKRVYGDWLRTFYDRTLRDLRRQNSRAKLGRYTAKKTR